MNGTGSLVEQIQQIAATLPAAQIDQLAAVVTGLDGPDENGRSRLHRSRQAKGSRQP